MELICKKIHPPRILNHLFYFRIVVLWYEYLFNPNIESQTKKGSLRNENIISKNKILRCPIIKLRHPYFDVNALSLSLTLCRPGDSPGGF